MDLHHPILREFPEHREIIRRLKGADEHFRKMFDEYHRLDDAVYRIEEEIDFATDQEIEGLKMRRAKLKDYINHRAPPARPRATPPPATAPESPARGLRPQAGRRTAQRSWPVTGAREAPKAFGEVRRITAHPYAKIARLDIGCLNPAGWRVYSPSPATLHFFVPWLGAVVREDHALCVKLTRRGKHATQNSVVLLMLMLCLTHNHTLNVGGRPGRQKAGGCAVKAKFDHETNGKQRAPPM